METLSIGKPSDDELSIGPDDKDMYQDLQEEEAREQQKKKKPSRYKKRFVLRPFHSYLCCIWGLNKDKFTGVGLELINLWMIVMALYQLSYPALCWRFPYYSISHYLFSKVPSGPNFIALLDGKQIYVLTVAKQNCSSLSVFHRLAEKLGGHIACLPWICIVTSFIFVQ